jgi:capsular polysaccharide biosynthesis protein
MTRFLVKLVKYWYLYLIPLLLIPTAATIYGQRKSSAYESTASLFVTKQIIIKNLGSQEDNPYATTAQNVSDQMAQLLQSSTFLKDVAQHTSLNADHSLDDPRNQTADQGLTAAQGAAVSRIAGNITVTANQTRNLVFITSDDKVPLVAQELANGVIQEFNAFYADKEKVTLESARAALTQQLNDITATRDKDTKERDDYASKHPKVLNDSVAAASDPTWQTLANQVMADVESLASVNSDLAQVNLQLTQVNAGTPYDLTVQDAPTFPRQQTVKVSKVVVYPIGALVAVLALLAIIAGIQTKLDRRVYDRQDIEGILDKLEWDPTAVEVMPIISANGGSGSIRWDDRENSPIPALMTPVLASLPRPTRKQLRSGTTQTPRRESQPESARRSSYVEDEP